MKYNFSLERKEATEFTTKKNAEFLEILDFNNREDFELAEKGFIATWPEDTIKNAEGKVVWDFTSFDKYDEFDELNVPGHLNPSLWRQGILNAKHGLFKIVDGVYQVRGFDLANIIFVRSTNGWVVIDALTVAETAAASYKMVCEHVEDLPITGVIITHSHADHFGGIRGLVTEEEVRSGKVPLVASYNFTYETGAENVIAGNIMNRRASYQFGTNISRDSYGNVGIGLGSYVANGTVSLSKPSLEMDDVPEQSFEIDGIEFISLDANNTEAVSEHVIYIPKYKTLMGAEVTCRNQHNLLTPRGAQVRSSLKWAKVIDHMLQRFGGEAEVLCMVHHWSIWGVETVSEYLEKQRDFYLFMHNETMRLANLGHTIHEIPYLIELPEELAKEFHLRGYYGHLDHNVKAVYQYYLGWWDGNPTTNIEVLPQDEGQKIVELAGGLDSLLEKTVAYYEKGEYRWVMQSLGKVLFAYPNDERVRALLADALEQYGYQQESGIRRNFFIAGATEIRCGIEIANITFSEELSAGLKGEQILDFIGVRFDGKKLTTKENFFMNINFTDTKEELFLELTKNKVLSNSKGKTDRATVTISGPKLAVFAAISGLKPVDALIGAGAINVEGDVNKIGVITNCLTEFTLDIGVVTP